MSFEVRPTHVLLCALLAAGCQESTTETTAELRRESASLALPYSAIVIAGTPLFYWRFEEQPAATAADSSGQNHPGTVIAGPLTTSILSANLGKGVRFTSSEDGIVSGTGDWTQTTELTVEAWIRPRDVRSDEGMIIVDKGDTWNLLMDANGKPRFQFPYGAIGVTGPTRLTRLEVYHLVGKFSAGRMKLYVNGVQVASKYFEGATIPIPSSSTPIHVGRGLSSGRWEFIGDVDEVAVYDRALSATAIQRHYERGRP